ncbi:hypothetical protein B0H14DRAFT_2626008 [Mycena olivaceomarginata]|nr:hypothetical protein B0H14DRAFT_2626008 [Mycena olivaceomarginata]
MSEEGSPAPVTPQKKRYGRMSTAARKPPPPPSNPYLDLEAVESGDSGEEENLDKYETDFIDDADHDNDDGTPISWPRTPSPTLTKAAGKAPVVARTPAPDPSPSRTHAAKGVKPNSVLPGTERGDVQGTLETVRKPSEGIVVNMGKEEHEEFMLFLNSKKPSFTDSQGVLSEPSSSTVSSGSNQTGAAIGQHSIATLPAPSWRSRDNVMAPADSGVKEAAPKPAGHIAVGATNTAADLTVQTSSKRKSLDDADVADTDTGTVGEGTPRSVKGSSRPTPKAINRSAPRRQESVGGSGLPGVPIAEFARLKESSPVKKPRTGDTVLHSVDIKTVNLNAELFPRELPAVCEVTNPELQDPMMKSIYALDLPKLKRGQVTTWSSNEGPGMFMLSEYPVINPELSIETLWSLLLFVQKDHYINPARIDPRLLQARSPVISRDGFKKRWVLSVGEKAAVCVSVVNTTRSSLREISTVYGGSNGGAPLLKYILGVHLSQDFDRITALCGMVFDLELMHVQLNMSALTFGTKGIPLEKYEQLNTPERKGIKSASSLYRKQTYTTASDSLNYDDEIPVYDARHTTFDASADIDSLDTILPLYKGEIPANSCTAVAYTISNFAKGSGRNEEHHLSFNIKWVVVLGEPE